MSQTQTIGFHVSGEFITDLMRTWFWEEHRPIQKCMELCDCVCGNMDDETMETVFRQIIEGRKKLVGIDTFDLVDDGEHIRTMTEYMVNQEKQKVIAQIKLDMTASFMKYVDIFATIKSTNQTVLNSHGNPNSFQECMDYFCKERSPSMVMDEQWIYINEHKRLIDMPTMGGLWLINEPETVYKACGGEMYMIGKDEFWHNIYALKKDDPDFADRNQRYEFHIAPKPTLEERINTLTEFYQKKHPQPDNEPSYLSNDWFDYQFSQTKELQYLMKPDDITNWEGLIAPNGDFYSVDFGSHNIKAYYLMVRYPERFGLQKGWQSKNRDVRADNALDALLEHGWCATRSIMFDQYMLPPLPKQPTKAQINTILESINKHEIHMNVDSLISYL